MIYENPRITGIMVNYYFHCKRQLWFFANHIEMEHNSDFVEIGRVLSEFFYRGKDKDLKIDDTIAVDWFDFRDEVLHEVKKSDSFEEGHIWQVKYYLFYFRKKGIVAKGKINYPKLKKTVDVELSAEEFEIMSEILNDILSIVRQDKPPEKIEKSKCRGCSYFQLCWSEN